MKHAFRFPASTPFDRAVLVVSVAASIGIAVWLWLFTNLWDRPDPSFAVYRSLDGVVAKSYFRDPYRSPAIAGIDSCGTKAEVRTWDTWDRSFGLVCVEVGVSNEEFESRFIQLNLLDTYEKTLKVLSIFLPALLGIFGGLGCAAVAHAGSRLLKWIARGT